MLEKNAKITVGGAGGFIGGALINLSDFGISPILFDGIFFRKAIAAEQIDGHGSDFFCRTRGKKLCHRRGLDKISTSIFKSSRIVNHQASRFDSCTHFSQLKLHALKLR